MSTQSLERELEWRNEQLEHLQSKIPMKAFVLYTKEFINDAERLFIETYRPMIQSYHRIQNEIELLESEAYICYVKESVQSLDEVIDLAETYLKHLIKRYGNPKHAIDKKTKQIQVWKKERYELQKELAVLTGGKYETPSEE